MESTNRYRATALKQVIEEQGRFREWVAAQGGVHPSQITRLIAGQRTVTEDVAVRIASALGVPFCLVFELSDASNTVTSEQEAIPA